MVTTQKRFAFLYGKVVVRAKLVDGQGLWPGIWMLPEGGSPLPEVDIAEEKGQYPTTIWMSQHTLLPDGQATDIHHLTGGADSSSAFHDYSITWTPSKLTWSIDGVVDFTQSTGIPNVPLYLILNLAVGGTFVGNPSGSTEFPTSMEVKFVHVYQANQQ